MSELTVRWLLNKDAEGQVTGAIPDNLPDFLSVSVQRTGTSGWQVVVPTRRSTNGLLRDDPVDHHKHPTEFDAMAAAEQWLYREVEKLMVMMEQVNKGYTPRTAKQIKRQLEIAHDRTQEI